MRTTINLPDDLHRQAKAIAHDRSRTVSEEVAWLMRRGLGEVREPELVRDELTGILTLRGGPVITAEDVKRFLDEDE